MPIKNGALVQDGLRVWSYDTEIKSVLPDLRTIGNITKYSVTTSKHQKIVSVAACDVLVNYVPIGTKNLATWFLAHPGWPFTIEKGKQ